MTYFLVPPTSPREFVRFDDVDFERYRKSNCGLGFCAAIGRGVLIMRCRVLPALLAALLMFIANLTADAQQAAAAGAKKKVVFIAGRPSHAYGGHEHNAGCLLLAKELQAAMPSLNWLM